MPKKCILCDKEAEYVMKGTNDGYCKECAEDNFGDVSYLVKAEKEANKIKELIKEKMDYDGPDPDDDNEEE